MAFYKGGYYMMTQEIDLDYIMQGEKIAQNIYLSIYKIDDIVYKVGSNKKQIFQASIDYLKRLEEQINRLEKTGVLDLSEVNGPLNKLYYNDMFIGYSSIYLENYFKLIEGKPFLINSQKIDLLIKLSKSLKKLHQYHVIHTDISSANVLSNGKDIKLIDFDDMSINQDNTMVEFNKSPYVDIVQLNELVLRFLTADCFDKNNKHAILPKEIRRYINYFNDKEWLHEIEERQLIRSSIPMEYPHDWLGDLLPFIGEKGMFQRKF